VASVPPQELHMKLGDQSQTIDVHEVQTIQFGVSSATPPAKSADRASATPEPAPAQPNNLILKNGTHVAGRWWSIDATTLHFLVNNQLQHYPRQDVLGVTFGNATLPAAPERSTPSTPSSPASAPPPAAVTQPARAPTLMRPSSGAPPAPPTAPRPSADTPPSTAPRVLSQPEEIGAVYFWNGKGLIPLEVNQAVERRSGSSEYWEMPRPQSSIRVNEASSLVFILRLPKGVDPAGYALFLLATVNGNRRTRAQAGRRGGLMTWPVDIQINDQSSLITYALTVKDLLPGEYSFSQTGSNDAYCFGVDSSAPGQ
jgi:hypothetical protein